MPDCPYQILVRVTAGGPFWASRGTGKSHLAQAIGRAAIHQGHRVLDREAHTLIEGLADAALDGRRKAFVAEATVPLLISTTLACGLGAPLGK
jgi:hypothetical protein